LTKPNGYRWPAAGRDQTCDFAIATIESDVLILKVREAGYEDNILLSSDFASDPEIKANGGAGYSSVHTVFVPKLRYAGVKEATI
jgi:predicted metal-dependent phosphotriesterase family hydrolase